ncbi:hypothetical protein CTRI78_v000237 [Colletotrichum trifolii]|uniref:Uncharacterized protein n=1 Tax=Colletotrichum trifolii TaxID=5466 RepID=A0A4R8RT55_COLTR|nr:hypothetical protein CTRI78_v000237 [Colletotrichum trifolii]
MRGENAQQQLARSVVFARPSAATSLPSAAFADITAQHASMAVRKKPSVNTLLIQGEIITGRYWTDSTRSNISFKPYPPQSSLRHRHQHIQNHPSSLLTTSSPRSPLSTAKSRERSAPHSAANQCSAGPSSTSVVSEEDACIESFVLEFGNDLTDDSLASSSASTIGISEDSLVPLCRKLLQHVHSLNPVLEGRDLLAYAKRASEHGIGWDSPSYLVTRAEEERSWLCYLADISLRRTIKDTVAVLYHQDERHWLGNKLVLARQYDEFEKKIPELSVSNPTAQPMNSPSTSKGASKAGANRPSAQHRHLRVIQLAQRAVDTCSAMVVRTAYHHRQRQLVRRPAGLFLRRHDPRGAAQGRTRQGSAELEGVAGHEALM